MCRRTDRGNPRKSTLPVILGEPVSPRISSGERLTCQEVLRAVCAQALAAEHELQFITCRRILQPVWLRHASPLMLQQSCKQACHAEPTVSAASKQHRVSAFCLVSGRESCQVVRQLQDTGTPAKLAEWYAGWHRLTSALAPPAIIISDQFGAVPAKTVPLGRAAVEDFGCSKASARSTQTSSTAPCNKPS
eukprot:CAMPEP_0197713834 /NCGR_PEP_ID=MMETSP1338-20131121/130658_1 /TAXON_ID=43686 ORGANISM="Pelagodinium beii, Strain RCC1491" /NCGR_SAMPLE_ID=MMETSP1338 /ASSEMBLY_ACC=CAM_ASM_000754 /LENGTH=190 /DNA_ID=CAMNT_0043297775 /DNA_START=652 /DNA_END=1220 /DNA_ORIENTATION=-